MGIIEAEQWLAEISHAEIGATSHDAGITLKTSSLRAPRSFLHIRQYTGSHCQRGWTLHLSHKVL
jgi:hypothetical protein